MARWRAARRPWWALAAAAAVAAATTSGSDTATPWEAPWQPHAERVRACLSTRPPKLFDQGLSNTWLPYSRGRSTMLPGTTYWHNQWLSLGHVPMEMTMIKVSDRNPINHQPPPDYHQLGPSPPPPPPPRTRRSARPSST